MVSDPNGKGVTPQWQRYKKNPLKHSHSCWWQFKDKDVENLVSRNSMWWSGGWCDWYKGDTIYLIYNQLTAMHP